MTQPRIIVITRHMSFRLEYTDYMFDYCKHYAVLIDSTRYTQDYHSQYDHFHWQLLLVISANKVDNMMNRRFFFFRRTWADF